MYFYAIELPNDPKRLFDLTTVERQVIAAVLKAAANTVAQCNGIEMRRSKEGVLYFADPEITYQVVFDQLELDLEKVPNVDSILYLLNSSRNTGNIEIRFPDLLGNDPLLIISHTTPPYTEL